MMIHWAAVISAEICESHPSETNRHGVVRVQFFSHQQLSHQQHTDFQSLLHCCWVNWHASLLVRQIKEVFEALSEIALIFAAHGRGLLPPLEIRRVESHYERYRENYNSSLMHWVCCLLVFPYKFSSIKKKTRVKIAKTAGLSLAALEEEQLRFPVRPKMHTLEPMMLGLKKQS